MDTVPSPTPSDTELKDLRAHCEYLHQLVTSLLLVLVVVSGTLSVFLLRQWRFVKTETETLGPQAYQLSIEYSNNYVPTQDFVKKVAEYGRTHQDFTPIFNKYRLNEALAKPGATSVTSSLPGAGSPKK